MLMNSGIIYNNGEEFVIHRDYLEAFLREMETQIEDEEYRNYVIKSNNFLLEEVANMEDEYIGLSIHPMDDCFFINQSLLE